MAEREKGVESTPCPNCDTALNVVEQPDGGTATERCQKCYPTSTPEKASRGQGRERGTRTEGGSDD